MFWSALIFLKENIYDTSGCEQIIYVFHLHKQVMMLSPLVFMLKFTGMI